MSKVKNSGGQEHDSDFESVNSDDDSCTDSISKQIQDAIKQLPDLPSKLQAIAINYHMEQKRELDTQLEKEQHKIEYQMRNNYGKQLRQIQQITQGSYHYTHDDVQFIKDYHTLFTQQQMASITDLHSISTLLNMSENMGDAEKAQNESKSTKLAPYWVKCLINSNIVGEQIHPNDEQLLNHLTQIRSGTNQENTKIWVQFFFSQNPWISNASIRKNIQLDKKGQPIQSHGDKPNWKQDKNFTIKKKKNKKTKKSKTVRQPSLFHFFDDVEAKEDMDSDMGMDDMDQLFEDLSLQHQLCEHLHYDLIPKSLEYYLGCNVDGDMGDIMGMGAIGEQQEPTSD